MRLKSKLHATCVGIKSSTVSGQGRGGKEELECGVRGCLNYIRCAAHGLLYLPETGRDRERGAGLVSALLCFASLSWTRTRTWTSEKLRTCWKNMH